jgi:hypothetical protein
MPRQFCIEDRVAVGFRRAVLEGARSGGGQVGRAVEEGFGTLVVESWRGMRVGERLWERRTVRWVRE